VIASVVIATVAWDCMLMASVSAGVSPLRARPDVVSVPVHVAVSVTADDAAATNAVIV